MATITQAVADLGTLSSELRRRNADVSRAIDLALVESKKAPKSAALPTEHALQKTLCAPFLLAVTSGNAKLMAVALGILSRYAGSRALAPVQVSELLQGFYNSDVVSLGLNMQLKVIQVLPALIQNYNILGTDLLQLLAVCCRLAGCGNIVVSNTASATMQQVFGSLFDKLRHNVPSEQIHTVAVAGDAGNENMRAFQVDALELECYNVFLDLSAMVAGDRLEYFDADIQIRSQSVLEIIESVLSLNKDAFHTHPELATLLRVKTVPALLKVLNSPSHNFPLVVRTLRIVHLLTSTQLDNLAIESEIVLSFANHIILGAETAASDSSPVPNPYWEKVLVLEMYKTLFSNFSTVRQIFEKYDNDPKKKNVVQEILLVMNNYLNNNLPQFFSGETIQVPPERGNSLHLSKLTSTLKVSILDHLDKQDPPANIPTLYTAHLVFRLLINMAEGVSEFVTNLSANPNADTLESDVEFITSMNVVVFPEIFQLFSKFIYCSTDVDYFHTTVRALQKYTHAIGLLGLSSLRDGLLLMLSDCVVNVASPGEDPKKNTGASHLLSIGESIVESLSSTIQVPAQAPTSPSQNLISQFSDRSVKSTADQDIHHAGTVTFNSRQVICLRALSNLAVSLGTTLQSSWKIIWVSFQWVDYFLEGPDEYSGYSNHKDPKKFGASKLSSQDLAGIQSSRAKFYESIQGYQQSSFSELFIVLTELYDFKEDSENSVVLVDICPYNRTFFIDRLVTIAKLNPTKFLLQDDHIWNHMINYFTNLATDRSIPYSTRNYLVKSLTDIIISVTSEGFEKDNSELTDELSEKSLQALITFINKLFDLGRPQELLVLNCETEMHLTVLTTLHGLIDEYDKYYQNSWELVFQILNTAFRNTQDKSSQDHNLMEKVRLLISTSFDTLKLILDEFLSTLPFNQIKSLIDTLLNFCSQKYDLNISFSSVSYFWLISDSIRANIAEESGTKGLTATTIEQLETSLLSSKSGTSELFQALNIYLLSKLAKLSADPRTQVREGAIQTLFQIIDVHGKYLPSWNSIYDIVLPGLLDSSNLSRKTSGEMRKEAIESLNLVLSGLVSVFAKYMLDFGNKDSATITLKFWAKFVEYLKDLLGMNWKDLNSKIFESYQDLILPLTKMNGVIPSQIVDLLFDFWVNVSIEYDFVNPAYQDSLAVYNESFKPLYHIIKDRFTYDDATKVLNNLNKCARYPILKANQNDNTKPTQLQRSVLINLQLLDKPGEDEQILAGVIQQLGVILAYPYETKSRIESKLKSKFEGKLKIPSFVAVSQLSLQLMTAKLHQLGNLNVLVKDKGFNRLLRSLLDLVHLKAEGVKENSKPLWVLCNELIVYLVRRLVAENIEDFKKDDEVWKLVIESITVCFEGKSEIHEEYNIKQYEDLTEVVLPVLFSLDAKQDALVDRFIQSIYIQSYLYKLNDIEKELTAEASLVEKVLEGLTTFHFDDSFGSTASLVAYNNRDIRLKCLAEMFRFASSTNRSSTVAMKYLVTRAAFTLRRFVADETLLYKKPLPKIQEEELKIVLQGLLKVQQSTETRHLQNLYRLLAQTVPFASRIEGMGTLVQTILTSGFMAN